MVTEAPTMRRTPLFDKHEELGAKMVPFAGYEMPIQYEGIVAEHRAVRGRAGLFDLSHMGEFFFTGAGAGPALDRLVSSDIAGLAPGVRDYEPHLALDGGSDGLAVIRRIVASAREALRPSAPLVLETAGGSQVGAVTGLLHAAGFANVTVRADLPGVDRFVAGRA